MDLLTWNGKDYVVQRRRLHDVFAQDAGPNPLLWWVFEHGDGGTDVVGWGPTKGAALAAAGLEAAAALCGCPRRGQ